jgi:hypothetical protein
MNRILKRIFVFLLSIALVLVCFQPIGSFAKDNKSEKKKTQSDQAMPDLNFNFDLNPNPNTNTNTDSKNGNLTAITATTKVAENNLFELNIDAKTGNIRLVNKKNQKEWLGSPQVDSKTLPNNKAYMDSPVQIKYTDGSSVSSTYTLKGKNNKVSIKHIDNGVRVNFDVAELKVKFALEYQLTENGFEVKIPEKSIKENGSVRIISLEVLPFFNAAKESDNGAVFVPDGSGALMTFKVKHPKYYSIYSEPVYGPDNTFKADLGEVFADGFTRSSPPKESIAMPVFGLYKNNLGYLGIITEGAEAANINATPAGIRNIPLYHTGAELIYRKQDVMFIGSSGKIPLFQGKMIAGDRKVKFILLEDEDANYVGLAKAYREYLIDIGVKAIDQKDVPLNIQLDGGILRDEILGSKFIEMTTFDQAQSIIDKYVKKGITHLNITLNGWSKNGIYGNQPAHFPVDKHLGGEKDLQDLVTYAKEKGVSLNLSANYVRPFQESDGFSKRTETVRGIDREVLESPNYHVSGGFGNRNEIFYLLKPEKTYSYISNEIDKYKELGISGVHLNYMGDLLYSDLDPNEYTSRKQTASTWVKSLDILRKEVGKTSVDYGFAYTFGHVDEIMNSPLDSSHFVMLDETVPFYQIVLHGLIPYTAKPSNLRNNSSFELLRAIEYGALPSFELTHGPTKNLRRTMEDRLFSSNFSYWFDKSVEEYQNFEKIYQNIGAQPIVNHEQVQPNVFKTTYENGTQIIVNYNQNAVTVDEQTIDKLDYAVKEGGN